METETESGQSQPGISDDALFTIAQAVAGEKRFEDLGLELGFNVQKLQVFFDGKTGVTEVTSYNASQMLASWRDKTPRNNQQSVLRGALRMVGLSRIADEHFPAEHVTPIPLTPSQITECMNDLKEHYRNECCMMELSSSSPNNKFTLEDIQVNLKSVTGEAKTPLSYDNILSIDDDDDDDESPILTVVVGEAGVGKTTLLKKIAHDWACGKAFKDIELLLLVFLRETEGHRSLGDVFKAYMSSTNDVQPEHLEEYANKYPDKVLILLDGLNEFRGKLRRSSCIDANSSEPNLEEAVVKMLRGEKFDLVLTIVTTRPSALDQITTFNEMDGSFCFIEMEGIVDEQVKGYAETFFLPDQAKSNSYNEFIWQGTLVADNMALRPLFCEMMCLLWTDDTCRAKLSKIETIHQLIDAFVCHLMEENPPISHGRTPTDKHMQTKFQKIGQKAYEGIKTSQFLFDYHAFEECLDGLQALQHLGIVLETKRAAPITIRQKTGIRYVKNYAFIHPLLQEYFAGLYLATCFKKDPPLFRNYINDLLRADLLDYSHILYFTAAKGRDVGKATLEILITEGIPKDVIVDTAFECHDKEAITSTLKSLHAEDRVNLLHDRMSSHTITSYLYVLDTLGQLDKLELRKTNLGNMLSIFAAKSIFSANNVRELSLTDASFQDCFYRDIVATSSASKIAKVTLSLQTITRSILRAILSVPSLQTLTVDNITAGKVPSDINEKQVLEVKSNVIELCVDDRSLMILHRFGLATMCSLVNKVTLICHGDEITTELMKCLSFPKLTDLHLKAASVADTVFDESAAICLPLEEMWPVLSDLVISGILIGNVEAEDILKTTKGHQSLKNATFRKCFLSDNDEVQSLYARMSKQKGASIKIEWAEDRDVMVSDSDTNDSIPEGVFDDYYFRGDRRADPFREKGQDRLYNSDSDSEEEVHKGRGGFFLAGKNPYVDKNFAKWKEEAGEENERTSDHGDFGSGSSDEEGAGAGGFFLAGKNPRVDKKLAQWENESDDDDERTSDHGDVDSDSSDERGAGAGGFFLAGKNPHVDKKLADENLARARSDDSELKLWVDDEEIMYIANSISKEDQVRHLGTKLGLKQTNIAQYIEANRSLGKVTTSGTIKMLFFWREQTLAVNPRSTLKRALAGANLVAIADKHLSEESSEVFLTKENANQCREDLIQFYREEVCKIKTSPLEPETYGDFETGFFDVVEKGRDAEPFDYQNILNTKVYGHLPTRIALVGDAGVGKSTLLKKITYDWTTKKALKRIIMLIWIPLRETDNEQSLGEIVKGYLPESNDVTAHQLDEYIKNNEKKVLVLLDGFDEFRSDVKDIIDILRCKQLTSCQVVVTSRPSHVDRIAPGTSFGIYKVVNIAGFGKAQVGDYVDAYFEKNREAADSLLRYMEEDSLLAETMGSNPLYCSMLCNIWADEKGREKAKTIETFFQFFDVMVVYMIDHFVSKDDEGMDDEQSTCLTAEDPRLVAIGEQSFKCLLENRFAFSTAVFDRYKEALRLALEMGLLTKKKKRRSGDEVLLSFPHNLLQEFFASVYLKSQFKKDPSRFNTLLTKKVMPKYHEVQYLLFFTAGQDVSMGRMTLEALRSKKTRDEIVVDTAFECHDKEAVRPIIKKLMAGDPAVLFHDGLQSHTLTSYLHFMDIFDPLHKISFKNTYFRKTLSRYAASAVFKLKTMRTLTFSRVKFDATFYEEMSRWSTSSKIEIVTHCAGRVDQSGSEKYAEGLCKLPYLKELEFDGVGLHETFYSGILKSCSVAKIETLRLTRQYVTINTLRSFLSLPCLRLFCLRKARVESSPSGNQQGTAMVASHMVSNVQELEIDDESLPALRRMGLAKMCPLVTKVTVPCYMDMLSDDIINSLHFPKLKELVFEPACVREDTSFDDTTSRALCQLITAKCPELSELTVSRIGVGPDEAEEILECTKQHQALKSITFDKCIREPYGGYFDELQEEYGGGRVEVKIVSVTDTDSASADYDEEEYEFGQREEPWEASYNEWKNSQDYVDYMNDADDDDEGVLYKLDSRI